MTVAPYGSWKSPIMAKDIASSTIGFSGVQVVGEEIFWGEMRPTEGGRIVVVCQGPGGQRRDVTAAPFNVRTRVHEYGGGAWLAAGGMLLFTNFGDQRLYRLALETPGEQAAPVAPVALTRPGYRYADFDWDARRGRAMCVRQDHTAAGEPANTIVGIDVAQGGDGEVLVKGNDFYSSPRLSPDGTQLAWLTWNHPDMPWDAAELWAAAVADDGRLGEPVHVAGGATESVCQPQWSPQGVLHFASDRNEWWNLYRWQGGQVRPLLEMKAEFALPAWVFGMKLYDFLPGGGIVCAYTQEGMWNLGILDGATGLLRRVDAPYSMIAHVSAKGQGACILGGSATMATALEELDLSSGRRQSIRRCTEMEFDEGYLSSPQSVEFPTTGGVTAHGLFYPPKNKEYSAPMDEKPPLVVMIHGGPTSATTSAMRLGIQYYTSRGVAVLDVNYGGSTGYGRAYRQRLNGQWGIVDVDDCCNGALYLARQGLVDGRRLSVTGGSAGGYTALAALAFRDVFAAAGSHFGVSDCEMLAKETHKFESRYLDRLIGPYPQRRDLYVQRSPLHHVESVHCPIMFFQGLEDKIVPPDQAQTMFDALRKRGIPTAYLAFEGEQHGFRRAANVRRALEAEFYFFSRVFGFQPADEIEPVKIENMEA